MLDLNFKTYILIALFLTVTGCGLKKNPVSDAIDPRPDIYDKSQSEVDQDSQEAGS